MIFDAVIVFILIVICNELLKLLNEYEPFDNFYSFEKCGIVSFVVLLIILFTIRHTKFHLL